MGTLWEKWTKSKVEPEIKKQQYNPPAVTEASVHNPLDLKINSIVKVKTIDLEDLDFNTIGIREIKRNENGVSHPIADYDLIAEPLDGPAIKKRIRLIPMNNANSQFANDVLLFDFVSEFGYDKAYYESLSSDECAEPHLGSDGKQEIDEKGQPVFDYFWRVNDVKTPWEAKTTYLADRDRNGKLDPSEIKHGHLTYWDFWRECKDGDGNDMLEFYIVEMDSNGYFEIWRGAKIDPSRISI